MCSFGCCGGTADPGGKKETSERAEEAGKQSKQQVERETQNRNTSNNDY